MTPVTAALTFKHREIALFLLQRGATQAADAIDTAIETGDVELARAALATKRLDPLELKAARKAAASQPSQQIRALLAEATVPAPARQPVSLEPEALLRYAGHYRGAAKGEATVSVRGENLVLSEGGKPELVLHPIGDGRFETAAGDAEARFGGRAGTIEGLAVNRDGDVSSFRVATPDPAPMKVAAAPDLGARRPVSPLARGLSSAVRAPPVTATVRAFPPPGTWRKG